MPELLEFVEAAFDQVALPVEALAIGDAIVSVTAGRDVRPTVAVLDQFPDPVGIVAFVSNDISACWQIVEQKFGHGGIIGLAGRQLHLHWQAIADDAGMELAGQSSAASTDRSASSLFFWAAAC